jgi:translation initiation factor 1 (eIF-1/SUI1)
VKGVQLNWAAAHGEAYRKAQVEIQGDFIQELLKSLYQ